MMTMETAIQDFYAEEWSYCYGCGRRNDHGLHVRTRWLDDQAGTTICQFTPEPHHCALPGFVYGGLLASLIDCHSIGTAALAAHRAEGRPPGSEPAVRFVTASLQVDFLAPTPLGPLELIGRIVEASTRGGSTYKVSVDVTVLAVGRECVHGHVLGVLAPADFGLR